MRGIFKTEIGRNLRRGNIGFFLIFLLFSVLIMQSGITKYQVEIKKEKEFIEVEATKVKRYINYVQYGIYGFRLMFKPSPLVSIFYNSTALEEMESFVDNGVRLKISKPELGPTLFERVPGGNMDLSWLVLVIGSLFTSAWGFFTFRNRDYIQFLMNFSKSRRIYSGILLARCFLLALALIIVFFLIGLLFILNGISVSAIELLGIADFCLVAFFVWLFFLVISSMTGTISKSKKAIVATVASWLVFVFLVPEAMGIFFSDNALKNIKSRYLHEIEKLIILMDFEAAALKEANSPRYKTEEQKFEADKAMGDLYWEIEFKKVEALEQQMIEETKAMSRNFHLWSIFTPVTFYKAVNNELSSRGYNCYLNFFIENQQHQKGFLRFYLKKRFYEKYGAVVPYMKKEKHVFMATSGLPSYFWPGLAFNFLVLAALFIAAYQRYRVYVFNHGDMNANFEKIRLCFSTGKFINLSTNSHTLKDSLLNAFYGVNRSFNGEITVDGSAIDFSKPSEVVFFPSALDIPSSVKVKHLYCLAGLKRDSHMKKSQRLEDIDDYEKVKLMLTLAVSRKCKINVIGDILKGLWVDRHLGDIQELIGDLKKNSVLIGVAITNVAMLKPDDFVAIIEDKNGTYKTE